MRQHNLTRDQARERAALISEPEYEIDLDLTGDDTFGTRATVRFSCARPGAETFLDFAGSEIHGLELNGREVPLDGWDGNRLRIEGLEGRNEVRVVGEGTYSKTGKGMTRFRDPVDGLAYCYTDLEPCDAYRVFPCFDQPDLKGTFVFSATVPQGWEVISNGEPEGEPATEDGRGRWRFTRTRPMSTYITALVAGPFHRERDRHEHLDLSVACRRSLAEHLEAEEWFAVTKAGFRFFEDAFGYPYSFDAFDQVVVPEYAAGAMENAGCVTYNERYVFRSRVTRTMREMRAETILHEMAHMWFGDLVTMRWWNDLWLNESFASYASVLALTKGTEFTDAWTTFANDWKLWALQQDQLPTTHPIVAEIPDVESVHLNFDGITYAKGASVLKQLVSWVGLERFLRGTGSYFRAHGFGNTELADFLGALEEASGRDLHAWSRQWLESPGVNTLRPRVRLDGGRIASAEILQEAPEDWPVRRDHRLAVGLYDEDGSGRLARRRRVELDVTGERTEVPELAGEESPALLLVNDDDLTFGKIRFDDRSLGTVRERLADIDDPLARSMCWAAVWDMTRDAELPTQAYLEVVLRHAPRETHVGSMERALSQAAMAIDVYGDPANRGVAKEALAAAALRALGPAQPGSDHQLAWARAFMSTARSQEHVAVVRGLLDGTTAFEGLVVDTDLRWEVVDALASAGLDDARTVIEEERRRDPTDKGARQAAAALAGRPTAEAKAEAWRTVLEDRSLTLAMLEAVMRGIQRASQEELLRPYAERFFEALPAVWDEREFEFAIEFGQQLYPKFAVEEATVERTDEYLARDGVPGPVRRMLLEGRDAVIRAIRARRADAAG